MNSRMDVSVAPSNSHTTDAHLRELGLLNLNPRQIEDALFILKGRTFSTRDLGSAHPNIEQACFELEEIVKNKGPIVAKIGDNFVVAEKGSSQHVLTVSLNRDVLSSHLLEERRKNLSKPEVLRDLIAKLPSSVRSNLVEEGSVSDSVLVAKISDSLLIARTLKNVEAIQAWGKLSSFDRETRVPYLAGNYSGNELRDLVFQAKQVLRNENDSILTNLGSNVSKTFKSLVGPRNRKIVASICALAATGKLGLTIGHLPTYWGNESDLVTLVQGVGVNNLKFPDKVKVSLDHFSSGQIASAKLISIQPEVYENKPAFRAKMELNSAAGLTQFEVFGSEAWQGISGYLTISNVSGANEGNFQVLTETASGALRALALLHTE